MITKQLSSLFVFNLLVVSAQANANQRWYVINDSVMGGVSNSQVTQTQESLLFTGNVSLDNNGGFASIRTELNTQSQNTKAIALRVKGDGQTYQLRLRTTNYLNGAAYTHSFKTVKNEWVDIKQLGFMIAGKQEGKFKLEVGKIEFKS
ncbi:CIA30 family protein [Pseudoalteromonas sp. SWYJZ98]|uniref:CIA30 family protein n=1 Tax=Pseudoalteromonas sp. SWYJZ98 TaxID=2792060 RepID=UPI0018CEEC19|nr:CIA30 family protein [Pseudoalteromonas sp. SWYJZ98]MBH0030772.1 CIA30 family protein [Pseudoalteromonas sp. SWYJZ98]